MHRRSKTPRRQGDASGGADDWRARTEDRVEASIEARLIRASGTSQKVLITNLSGEGAGLEGVLDLAIGERVLLLLPNHQVHELAIRWVVGDQAGARFTD